MPLDSSPCVCYTSAIPNYLFFYDVVKLWEIPAETIFQMNLTGLLPLIPLTENGKRPEHIQAMIDGLAKKKEMDLLSISSIVGSLVFTEADEREWFKRRFFMFQDILRESWMVQEIGEDFFNEGIKKGLEQGLEQERQKELLRFRQMVRDVAQMRFSELISLAEQQAEKLEDPDALQHLTMQLFGAYDMDAARELLLQIDKIDEQN
jgi:predicted transposase YdaD